MSIASDFIANLNRMLSLGGTDGFLVYADSPTVPPFAVRFLLGHPLMRDEALINAYGVNALVITLPATPTLLAKPPKKFDLILLAKPPTTPPTTGLTAPYALDAVKLHQLANTAVAFTAYVKGKGE